MDQKIIVFWWLRKLAGFSVLSSLLRKQNPLSLFTQLPISILELYPMKSFSLSFIQTYQTPLSDEILVFFQDQVQSPLLSNPLSDSLGQELPLLSFLEYSDTLFTSQECHTPFLVTNGCLCISLLLHCKLTTYSAKNTFCSSVININQDIVNIHGTQLLKDYKAGMLVVFLFML